MAGLDRVDTENAVVLRRKEGVRVCRDVFAGTERMRERRTTYLPLFPGEKRRPAMYDARLERTVLFNALQRTVQGLVGMMFRVDPVLDDDVPDEIAGERKENNEGGHWENIDLAGTPTTQGLLVLADAVLERFGGDSMRALLRQHAEAMREMRGVGLAPRSGPPAEFEAWATDQRQKWLRVAREAGVKLD